MNTRKMGLGKKWLAMSLVVATALAMPLSASAAGYYHGGGGYYRGGGGYYRGGGGYYRGGYGGYWGGGYGGGYWSGGRWIAGALIAGAATGLVASALNPGPVYYPGYYAPPPAVVYTQPTVVYQSAPVVQRVVTTTYSQPTQYIGDQGY